MCDLAREQKRGKRKRGVLDLRLAIVLAPWEWENREK